ncbi:hypothetical protein BaRGS_00033610 [Batillaria attramentaria]|uniref:Uncharacterized protein n=1 Tax=Batillaria attramentaria TaxID=370345 RepID=A0ABD0JJF0_9CAEN
MLGATTDVESSALQRREESSALQLMWKVRAPQHGNFGYAANFESLALQSPTRGQRLNKTPFGTLDKTDRRLIKPIPDR